MSVTIKRYGPPPAAAPRTGEEGGSGQRDDRAEEGRRSGQAVEVPSSVPAAGLAAEVAAPAFAVCGAGLAASIARWIMYTT